MATAEPQKWSATLGANADVNTLPATTPAGSGRASTGGLFPPITQRPLDEGGLAPERGDFNALFKYLGEYLFYLMQGGTFSYTTDYDYTAGNLVMHGGSLYLCIASNGPGSAIKYPTDAAYWRQLALTSQLPTVNNGTLTIQRNGSNVATFSANQAGNTTANISVPTVNDGTLTIQKDGATVATFSANQAGNTTANISVPTVNDGRLTINVNGSQVATFTANQAGNSTANITVPAAPTVGDGELEINVDGSTVATFTANQAGNSTANITISEIDSQSVSGGAGWVRFKSGIQIVFGAGTEGNAISFPVAFVTLPRLQLTCPRAGNPGQYFVMAPGWFERTTTYFSAVTYNVVNSHWETGGNFDYIAIGFWK